MSRTKRNRLVKMYGPLIIVISLCVGSVFSSLGSFYLPKVFDYKLYENVLDPELCQEQLTNINLFEFYDASFRVPQGISKGNFMSLGSFHQCLEIKQDTGESVAEGKYCMIRTSFHHDTIILPKLFRNSSVDDMDQLELNIKPIIKVMNDHRKTLDTYLGQQITRLGGVTPIDGMSLSLALCIPKSCSVVDVLSPYINNSLVPFDYNEEFCRLPGDKPLVAADYTAIVIFSIIGILTLLSTAYELRHIFLLKKDPGETNELLRCFSLYTNTKDLMTFRESSPGSIDCIDGIRSISILWIVVGHTFLAFGNRYTANILNFLEWFGKRRAIWLRSATISVDTFLLLSGLLLVYTCVRKIKQMQLLKGLHVFYLNRILRMFPLLACAVLLQASVFNQVSDGANWHFMAEQVEPCRKYWWTALLHIQNLVNTEEYCVPQTWYLSVDVQLHILSPLILYWVLGSRRSAWSGLAIGSLAALTASTIYCFLKDFTGSSDHQVYYYKNTLTRSPPFLVGMVFGYVLHLYRGHKVRMPYWSVALGYSTAWLVSSYCLYDSFADWDSLIIDNVNWSFMRACWASCVCWIIFACVHGYGGPINWFLSLTVWKFMAKISYAMYLFHYSILFAISGSMVTSFYFSLENIFLMCASVIVYTMIASTAACILIDAPFSILVRRLIKVLSSSTVTKKVETEPSRDAPAIGKTT